MINYLLLIYGIAVFVLSGLVLLSVVDRKNELGFSILLRIPLAFLFGFGLLSLQMFLYSLVSIKYSVLLISLPWLLLSFYFLIKRGRVFFGLPWAGGEPFKRGLPELIFAIIIAYQVVYAFISALLFPIRAWDAWAVWLFKSSVFFIERGVTAEFLQSATYGYYSGADYPLLLPLSGAWIYTCLGMVDDQLVKIIFPLLFVSMLLVFYCFALRVTRARLALFITALLSLVPTLMVHAGGYFMTLGALLEPDYVGLADLHFAAYFFASGVFFYLYMRERKSPFLLLFVFSFLMAAWTKNEGYVLILSSVLSIIFYQFFILRERPPWPVIIAIISVLLIFIFPWLLYKNTLELTNAIGDKGIVIMDNLGRLSMVFKETARMAFLNVEISSVTWYLYIITSVLAWRETLRSRHLLLHFLLFAQYASYCLVFVVTPANLDWHINTTIDRLLTHLLPLAFFISLINIATLINWGRADSSSAGDSD